MEDTVIKYNKNSLHCDFSRFSCLSQGKGSNKLKKGMVAGTSLDMVFISQ